MNELIERTKKLAVEELDNWQSERSELLMSAKICGGYEVMAPLFSVADQLTKSVKECLEIKHKLTPEIVAVVSSVILGITCGDVMGELEKLLSMSKPINTKLQ